MKKKLVILLTIAVFHIGLLTELIAQVRTSTSISLIALMKPGNTSQGLYLGNNTAKAEAVLGKPTAIKDEYLETQHARAKVYTYGANKLYFVDDKLSGFTISDASIIVGPVSSGSATLPNGKIGDKIKVETKTIPTGPDMPPRTETVRSFHGFPLTTKPKPDTSRNITYKTISITPLTEYPDSRLELLFNAKDELISIYVSQVF